MTKLWLATTNQGKLREFSTLMRDLAVEIHSLREISYYTPPPENGSSFLQNARIKARGFRAVKPEDWVAAEDSGLEVDGLNKLPGIHSARYAGERASDAENNAKLLKMLQIRSPQNRQARFVCCLVVLSPQGEEYVFEGVLSGTIAIKAQGKEGFGYDPVFIPDDHQKTLAELGVAVKNQISHRAQAIRKLRSFLHDTLKEQAQGTRPEPG